MREHTDAGPHRSDHWALQREGDPDAHRVAVAGFDHPLPAPFHVLATQNPIEQEGTYPLPEAQLDRFLLQIDVTYPD